MRHPHPRPLLRVAAAILALALVAAACGDADDADDAPGGQTTVTTEAPPTETAETETTEAEAAGGVSGADTTESEAGAECAAGERSFDHPSLANGPLCVPEDPERVVDLSTDALEVLVATGDAPVGTQTWATGIMGRNFPYLADRLDGVADLGFQPINLEAVALAEPDLIVVGEFERDNIGEELEEIATTAYFIQDGSGDWRSTLDFAGQLLNRQDVVDERFAEYEARVADLREAVGDPSEIEISVVRVQPDPGEVMMNLVKSYPSVILADVGFARPESQALSSEEALERYDGDIGGFISTEELQLIDADHIFLWSQTADPEQDALADAAYEDITQNPLWDTLDAVQRGNFTRVDGHWIGWGFHAAHAILDDLFVEIAGVDPAEVSPNPFTTGR